MRNLLLLSILAALLLSSCAGILGGEEGKNGELTGVMNRPTWDEPLPEGMIEIPAGTYHMGQNDQDVDYSQIAPDRQVTVSSFYMDITEIENNEYRQFIKNVMKEENEYAFRDSIITWLENYYDYDKIDAYEDFMSLAKPDTLVWMRDFTFAYNEPLTENYWWHPAFDNYPVVGVSWYGAQAFCYWRTLYYNTKQERGYIPPDTDDKKLKAKLPRFRLPTESEWEYAARGGYEHNIYPWEGPYIRNSKGCPLANYKPGRGDYISDSYEYTSPAKSYWPNEYGLYNMVGNVSEWCEDHFEESGYTYADDLNPIYRDPEIEAAERDRRRVVRGGSWKDIAYYLSVGSRNFEYADTTKAYIGFRTVVSELADAPSDLN